MHIWTTCWRNMNQIVLSEMYGILCFWQKKTEYLKTIFDKDWRHLVRRFCSRTIVQCWTINFQTTLSVFLLHQTWADTKHSVFLDETNQSLFSIVRIKPGVCVCVFCFLSCFCVCVCVCVLVCLIVCFHFSITCTLGEKANKTGKNYNSVIKDEDFTSQSWTWK